MNRIAIVAWLTVQDILHRKALYVLLAIIMVLAGTMTVSLIVVSRVAPTAERAEAALMESGLMLSAHGTLWSLGTLAFVILAMVSISSEITQGTGVMLLSKSVARRELFLGKVLGVFAMGAAYSAVAVAVLTALCWFVRGTTPAEFWLSQASAFLWLTVTMTSACAFAAALNLVPALSLWLLVAILQGPFALLAQTNIRVLADVAGFLRYLYPASALSELFLRTEMVASAKPISLSEIWLPILHMVDYSIIMLLVGMWFFSKRNLLAK